VRAASDGFSEPSLRAVSPNGHILRIVVRY
jgi:hypothetical protein